jgi:uncharacterized OB-fold protein
VIDAPIAIPLPVRDALNAPYWDALEDGNLVFQRCFACSNAWLPARQECPNCLHDAWSWEVASGDARLVSWVVFHVAFHPSFKGRLPYTVAVVELAEGPRLISNIVDIEDPESLVIEQALELTIEREGDMAIPRFRPRSQ